MVSNPLNASAPLIPSPPNNWLSVFGGSVWQWDELRRAYYLHQFLVEQPDLNYRNPLVVDEMLQVIRFWLDKGVDGFRVDAFAHLVEEEPLLGNDEPRKEGGPPVESGLHQALEHTKTMHQPECFTLLLRFRQFIDEYKEKHGRDHVLVNLPINICQYIFAEKRSL